MNYTRGELEEDIETVLGPDEGNDLFVVAEGDSIDFSIEFANFDDKPPLYNVAGIQSGEDAIERFATSIDLSVESRGSMHITFEGHPRWLSDVHAKWIEEILGVFDYDLDNVADTELKSL